MGNDALEILNTLLFPVLLNTVRIFINLHAICFGRGFSIFIDRVLLCFDTLQTYFEFDFELLFGIPTNLQKHSSQF